MDKTLFRRQSLRKAEQSVKYWLSRPVEERLEAAYCLSMRVWGYDPKDPPGMDKTLFRRRSRQSEPPNIRDQKSVSGK